MKLSYFQALAALSSVATAEQVKQRRQDFSVSGPGGIIIGQSAMPGSIYNDPAPTISVDNPLTTLSLNNPLTTLSLNNPTTTLSFDDPAASILSSLSNRIPSSLSTCNNLLIDNSETVCDGSTVTAAPTAQATGMTTEAIATTTAEAATTSGGEVSGSGNAAPRETGLAVAGVAVVGVAALMVGL